MWAIGLILSAVVAFGAHGTLVDVVDDNGTAPYTYNSTSEMDVVGVSGFVTTLLGVCATLFVGGCVLKNEIRTMPWILYLIFDDEHALRPDGAVALLAAAPAPTPTTGRAITPSPSSSSRLATR